MQPLQLHVFFKCCRGGSRASCGFTLFELTSRWTCIPVEVPVS